MPSSTSHPACPGRATIHQPPVCWDTPWALAGTGGLFKWDLAMKQSLMNDQTLLAHHGGPHSPPPGTKLDNMAYFISVPPWLLQLFGSIYSPAHYFSTPPWPTVSKHELRRAVTQQHCSSEEEDMVKRSVTLLQRDANYSSSYAEAGQASCDCRTKPPTRRICEDQGQEEESQCYSREKRFPQQLRRPLEQDPHIYHTYKFPLAGQNPGAGQRSRGASTAHGIYWNPTAHHASRLSARLSLRAPQTGISWKLPAESTVDLL